MIPFDIDLESGDWFVREMPKGQRTKYELRPLQAIPPVPHWQWYWKSAIPRAPFEVWSEVLAYEIGTLIGVDVPLCVPSKCHGTWGVLVKSFLESQGDSLIHGGDLLAIFDPHYDREMGTRGSIQAIQDVLRSLGNEALVESLFRILLFDALIGNRDRHQENWGLVIRKSGQRAYEVAPAFDNGASLAKEFKADEAMANKWATVGLSEYAERGTSEVRWQTSLTFEHLTHFEFLHRHFQSYPWSVPIAEELLSYNSDAMLALVERTRVLSQLCEGIELSDYRAEQIVALVAYRRRRILEMLS